jgi:hypothetical protein
MATLKALENSVEFTKHVMTLSGAGMAFVITLDLQKLANIQRISIAISIIFLAVALAAGLLVWSRATVMMAKSSYNLDDRYLKIPGLINLFSFAFGVVSLGAYVIIRLFDANPQYSSSACM